MPTEIFATFGMLVLMALVFAGAYWASRFLARHYQGTAGHAKSIRILERAMVGRDSSLMLVKVNQKVCLLGVSAKQITLLETFPADEILNTEEQPPAMISFGDMLKKFREKGSSTND